MKVGITAREQRLVHALAKATGLLRTHALWLMDEDPETSGAAVAGGLLSEIADFVILLREFGIDAGDPDGLHCNALKESGPRAGMVAVRGTGEPGRATDRVTPGHRKDAT